MSNPLDRRTFLVRLWKWGVGLVGLAGAWTSWDVLKVGAASGLGGKVRTVPIDQVPAGNVLAMTAARTYLTRSGDEIIALSWKCPHLACRTAWCESSGQFECPCHGSVFNRIGEYRSGPAPRGLDRFATEVVDGFVVVDTGTILTGGPPGSETIDEPPRGPSCREA